MATNDPAAREPIEAMTQQQRDLVKAFEGHPIVEAWSAGYDAGREVGVKGAVNFLRELAEACPTSVVAESVRAAAHEVEKYLALTSPSREGAGHV